MTAAPDDPHPNGHDPRPGGWGWVTTGGRCDWGSEPDTTQQRTELTAVRELLCAHPDEPLLIQTSAQVINVFTEWLPQWRKRNMRNSRGKCVKNRDLIEQVDGLLTGRDDIGWQRMRRPSRPTLEEAADRLPGDGATMAWAFGSWPRADWIDGRWPQDRLTAATDGSSLGSPGPGGWGWVTSDGRCAWGSKTGTTHNRMELTAVRELLCDHPDQPLLIQPDSTYVIDIFEGNSKPVKNLDLINQINKLLDDRRVKWQDDRVEWQWVRGHSGHALNEIADRLAGHGATTAWMDNGPAVGG